MNKWPVMTILMVFCIGLTACQTGTSVSKKQTYPPTYAEASNLYDALEALSVKLIDSTKTSIQGKRISKIAVADFIGPGDRTTGLGEYISDKVSVQLFASEQFPDFMERRQLKQVLQTHKNELSGYFDQDTVKNFGKMIGIDSMVIGVIEDLGSFFDITAKIVESETGRILGMADVRVIKDDATDKLVEKKFYATLTISVLPPVNGKVVAGGKQGFLDQGVVTFSGIPYGECQVIIQPRGYDPVHKSIPVRSPSESFSVWLKSKTYEVSFQIVPPEATLTVNGKNIQLNSQGFAIVNDLKGQEYSYVVNAKGHDSRLDSFNPAHGQALKINLLAKDPFYELKNKFFLKYKQMENSQAFSVRLWTNKTTYRIGDPIFFYFRSEKDCYVSLVNISSSGNITQIFPNKFHSDNYIRAGIEYRIPGEHYGFEFQVEPPAGTERIYAIASNHPLNIFRDNFSRQAFTALTRGKTRDIGVHQVGGRLDQADLKAAAECVIHTR